MGRKRRSLFQTLFQTLSKNIPSRAVKRSTFDKVQTLKFKAQPTNSFSATINQMLGGSSQLPTTSEHCFVVWTVLNDLITVRSAVVGGFEKPPKIWLAVEKYAFVGWALNFKVRVLLKGVVAHCLLTVSEPHMNSKPLSIICSMLSRGILNIFHVADTCFKCNNKTQTRMLLSEREKLLQRKSQEERHKTPFKLPKEPEEQRRTRTYTHRTQKK